MLQKIISYFKRIYFINLSPEKQAEIVWKQLKNLHEENEWPSGVYEKEKKIESVFHISDNALAHFYQGIFNNQIHYSVRVIEDFPEEFATDIFILATHFTNLLAYGRIIVNSEQNYVEYTTSDPVIVPLLQPEDLLIQLVRQYEVAQDIYRSFQRLLNEEEEPAIIIADLLREKNSDTSDED